MQRIKFSYRGIRYHMIIPTMKKESILDYLKNLIDGVNGDSPDGYPSIMSTSPLPLPYIISSQKKND